MRGRDLCGVGNPWQPDRGAFPSQRYWGSAEPSLQTDAKLFLQNHFPKQFLENYFPKQFLQNYFPSQQASALTDAASSLPTDAKLFLQNFSPSSQNYLPKQFSSIISQNYFVKTIL